MSSMQITKQAVAILSLISGTVHSNNTPCSNSMLLKYSKNVI